MATARVNDVEIYFDMSGSGSPCIALHGGLGFDHTYMRSALSPLEGVAQFVYIDQRGNGRSERPSLDTITIPQLASDVEALREHLGLESVGLLGHSFGGFVALEYATTHPDKLSHLVLMDTSPGVFEPTAAELAERADRSWITPAVEKAFSTFASFYDSNARSNDEFVRSLPDLAPAYLYRLEPEVLAEVLAAGIVNAEVAKHSMTVALPGWSVADKLDRISCPTLVICGRHDLLTTPECAKRLATAIPGADLMWFEKSGHFPPLEEPESFSAAVRDWLNRCA